MGLGHYQPRGVVRRVDSSALDKPECMQKAIEVATPDVQFLFKRARNLFDRLDTENNGFVVARDFIVELQNVDKKFFAPLDFIKYAGRDTFMSWPEFCAAMKTSGLVANEAMTYIYASTMTAKDKEVLDERLRKLRKQFDKVAGPSGVV